MNPGDSITLLRACSGSLRKFVHPDGNITRPNLKFFDLAEHPIADLRAIEQLLRELENRGDLAVLRGAPADPNRVAGVRKLFYADPETGDAPTIIEAPRRWIAFDIDDIARPTWVDAADLVGCAAVAIYHLSAEFKRAALVVQATASHGIKPGLRLRLWFWLDRAVCSGELRYWMRNTPVDRALFSPAQTIITAAPVFLRGAVDPLPARLIAIPGERSEVEVPAPEQLRPPPVPKRPPPTAFRRAISPNGGARDISGLVRTVEHAANGDRNKTLFWAACRIAEDPQIDPVKAAAELQAAAEAAGLDSRAARDTIESGLRRGRPA